MKLPIKDEFFKEIKSGAKDIELRDAHITFVNEKTGETLTKQIKDVELIHINGIPEEYHYLFTDEILIQFELH